METSNLIKTNILKLLQVKSSRDGVKGQIRIRISKNENDFLNNVMPDAIKIFVNGLVKSITTPLGITDEAKLYEIHDALELHLKDEFTKFVRKSLPEWLDDDDDDSQPPFEGGENPRRIEKQKIIDMDNNDFDGEDDVEFN